MSNFDQRHQEVKRNQYNAGRDLNIGNKVVAADISDELRVLLNNLVQAVENMSNHLSKETAQQARRDLRTLVEEAASKSPRQEQWQVSIEGLRKAAVKIGEVGKPVLEIVAQIIPLFR